MRLWHVDLIPYLPDIHLLTQWRELCAIVKDIAKTGTTHHVLINPIMDYGHVHFYLYSEKVADELRKRGKKIDNSYKEFIINLENAKKYFPNKEEETDRIPYPFWHNDRYLQQCYYNLQEKFDRGMITEKEWRRIDRSEPIAAADFSLPF